MNQLYIFIGAHINGQQFSGTVRGHSLGVYIDYYNNNPIDVVISNVFQNHQDLINKTVVICLINQNPVRGNLCGLITDEVDSIEYFTN